MTKIYLTRHGETEWNVEGRLQGHKDSTLTTKGITQASWLGETLRDIPLDVVLTSSSGRTVQTAEILCQHRDIEVVKMDALKEINLGEWEGKLHADIKETDPEQYYFFWNEPHHYIPTRSGESFEDVVNRASQAIETAARKYPGNNILIVTHAVVLKSLMAYFENKPISELWSGAFMHATCLNIVEHQNNKWHMILQGDTSHYK